MNTPAPIITLKPLYLDRESAAAYLSISSSLLEKLVAKGAAPKPRKLSANRCAWLVEDLEQWGRERPVSDLLPARGSGYGRVHCRIGSSEIHTRKHCDADQVHCRIGSSETSRTA